MKTRKRSLLYRWAEGATLLCGLLILASSLAVAQGGVVNSTQNPQQLALLHWGQANQAPVRFSVGRCPQPIVFDGTSIWIADMCSNITNRLQSNDGRALMKLTTQNVPSLNFPDALAYDGANIWVSNSQGPNPSVTKVQASRGEGSKLVRLRSSASEFPMEPGPRNIPIALDCGTGNVQCLGSLFDRQPAKKSQLYNPALAWV